MMGILGENACRLFEEASSIGTFNRKKAGLVDPAYSMYIQWDELSAVVSTIVSSVKTAEKSPRTRSRRSLGIPAVPLIGRGSCGGRESYHVGTYPEQGIPRFRW